MPIIYTANRRLYECDCCGNKDVWRDGWAWFGSYRQHEDFGLKDVKPIMTICSRDCRVKLVDESRLPPEGLDDDGNVREDAADGFRR